MSMVPTMRASESAPAPARAPGNGREPQVIPGPALPPSRRFAALQFRSIRTKLLLLVAGVALFMGMVSAFFFSLKTNRLLNDQVNKQGAYIAANLANNSEYGVLTED